jgi:hypothetical protein
LNISWENCTMSTSLPTDFEGFLAACRTQYSALEQSLSLMAVEGVEHGKLEEHLHREGAELMRSLLQAYLDYRCEKEEKRDDVKGADGVARTQRRSNKKKSLETIFGEVVIRRIEYSSKYSGVPSLHLADAELNVSSDKFSDGLRRLAVEESSKVSFDEASSTILRVTNGKVAKRQCEELTVKVAQDFDDFYAQRTHLNAPSDESELLCMSCDGKGIVLHQEDLREPTRTAAQESSDKNKKKRRLGPGEKRNRKRMATVAAVYGVNRHIRTPEEIMTQSEDHSSNESRPKVVNKRVWASVESSAREVIEDMFDEAQARDPEGKKDVVVLVDGNNHQLQVIEEQAKKRKIDITVILDIIHVIQYLWAAAHALFGAGNQEAEEWVSQRLERILKGQVSLVAAGMRQSATKAGLSNTRRKPIDTCAEYLLKYSMYMQYNHYLEQGYPIATGVIEGACRHLVADRMDITGARWRLERAEAVLKIRALRSSKDFDQYWEYHKQRELHRNHTSKLHQEFRLAA